MFTIDQILTAHAKIKSGADFPKFVKEIGELGVIAYETAVIDGHTDYSDHHHKLSSAAKYAPLLIAEKTNRIQFQSDLEAHQQGKTDYFRFCNDCARSGVVKWMVSIKKMDCTYYDQSGGIVLSEMIPVAG